MAVDGVDEEDTTSARGAAWARDGAKINHWPVVPQFAHEPQAWLPHCLRKLRGEWGQVDRRVRGVWARPPSASCALSLAWDGHKVGDPARRPPPARAPPWAATRKGNESPRGLDPGVELERRRGNLLERFGKKKAKIFQKVAKMIRAERMDALKRIDEGTETGKAEAAAARKYAQEDPIAGETASLASAEIFEAQPRPDKYHFHSEAITKAHGRARLPRRGVRTFSAAAEGGSPEKRRQKALREDFLGRTTPGAGGGSAKQAEAHRGGGGGVKKSSFRRPHGSNGPTDYSFNFLWPPEFAYARKERPKFKVSDLEAQRVDMQVLTPMIGSTIHSVGHLGRAAKAQG